MTPKQAHRHVWIHYQSGWFCTLCGRKTGFDYQYDPEHGRPKE